MNDIEWVQYYACRAWKRWWSFHHRAKMERLRHLATCGWVIQRTHYELDHIDYAHFYRLLATDNELIPTLVDLDYAEFSTDGQETVFTRERHDEEG